MHLLSTYANIVSINGTILFPLHQFSYVFISIANLGWGIKTCFYNGIDDYAKMWLQLMIAASLIIGKSALPDKYIYTYMMPKGSQHPRVSAYTSGKALFLKV